MRAELKAKVDEAVRARTARIRARYSGISYGNMFCSGCGIGADNWTPGCRTCGDRWRRWRRVGTVTEQRFMEEKARVNDFSYDANVRSGGFSHGKPPVSTWNDHRRALGVPLVPIFKKKPR